MEQSFPRPHPPHIHCYSLSPSLRLDLSSSELVPPAKVVHMLNYYGYNTPYNYAPQGPPQQPMPAAGPPPTSPHAGTPTSTPSVVRLRVCDLHVLSGHTPILTSTGSGNDSGTFSVDGLYVVVRLGTQVGQTRLLTFVDEACGQDDVVDTYHTEGEGQEDGDYAELPLLLSDGTRRGAKPSRLVWDEVFELYPDKEDGKAHSSSRPSGASLHQSGTVPVLIDLELWRSTTAAERCIGRYAYNVPMEAFAFLSQQRQSGYPGGGATHPPDSAHGAGRRRKPAAPVDPTAAVIIVDKVVTLQMAAGAGGGNSPSFTASHSGGGGGYGYGRVGNGSKGMVPVKLGLRLRVQSTGVPLPPPPPMSVGGGGGGGSLFPIQGPSLSAMGPGWMYGLYPPPSSTADGSIGYFGGVQGPYMGMAAVNHAAATGRSRGSDGTTAYGLLSGTALLHDGLPSAAGYGSDYGPAPGGLPGAAVLDPLLLSGLLSPMVLRSSLMTHPGLSGPPSPGNTGTTTTPSGAYSFGFGGAPPPLMMPGSTASLGAPGGGGATTGMYSSYAFASPHHPQQQAFGYVGNLSSSGGGGGGGLLDSNDVGGGGADDDDGGQGYGSYFPSSPR